MLAFLEEGEVCEPTFRIYSVKLLYRGFEVGFYFFWKMEMRNLIFTKVMDRPVITANCEEKGG